MSWPGNLSGILANANTCAMEDCWTPVTAPWSTVLWTVGLGVVSLMTGLPPSVRRYDPRNVYPIP